LSAGNAVEQLIRRALRAIGGGVDTYTLRARLGVDDRTLELLLGALLSGGLIQELRPADCASCPIAKVCGMRGSCGLKVYRLTDRGRRLLDLDFDDVADD